MRRLNHKMFNLQLSTCYPFFQTTGTSTYQLLNFQCDIYCLVQMLISHLSTYQHMHLHMDMDAACLHPYTNACTCTDNYVNFERVHDLQVHDKELGTSSFYPYISQCTFCSSTDKISITSIKQFQDLQLLDKGKMQIRQVQGAMDNISPQDATCHGPKDTCKNKEISHLTQALATTSPQRDDIVCQRKEVRYKKKFLNYQSFMCYCHCK